METEEHFYADDPSRGPADGKTTLEGVDYFFLGNGRIQAAVQVTRAEGATPVGLLIMDPERFGPKRAALTFDGSAGIAGTAVSILIGDVRDDRDYRVARGDRVTCEQTDRDYRVARGDRVTCEQTDRDYRGTSSRFSWPRRGRGRWRSIPGSVSSPKRDSSAGSANTPNG